MFIKQSCLAAVALFALCRADCPPVATNLEQTLSVSTIALRVKPDNDQQVAADLPCTFLVYDSTEGEYRYDEQIPVYEIIEVFKGNDTFTVGESIPVLYSTDTGYRLEVPTRFSEDEEGFLVYLSPDAICFEKTTNATFSGDSQVYSMNECLDHEPWQNLSEDEKALLRGESPSPTKAPVMDATSSASPVVSPTQAVSGPITESPTGSPTQAVSETSTESPTGSTSIGTVGMKPGRSSTLLVLMAIFLAASWIA